MMRSGRVESEVVMKDTLASLAARRKGPIPAPPGNWPPLFRHSYSEGSVMAADRTRQDYITGDKLPSTLIAVPVT